jgi:hypothetical protein
MNRKYGRNNQAIKVFILLLFTIIFIFFTTLQAVSQEEEDPEDLNVFWKWVRWNNPGSFLIDHYLAQADQLYVLRDREIEKLNSKKDWQNRQAWVRKKLNTLIGPFPEKTALNPRITDILQKDGYRIEKLVYESMPGFYVAGCVFIPDGIKGKAPAILNDWPSIR